MQSKQGGLQPTKGSNSNKIASQQEATPQAVTSRKTLPTRFLSLCFAQRSEWGGWKGTTPTSRAHTYTVGVISTSLVKKLH